MSEQDAEDAAMDLVAIRFAKLWRALTHDGERPRDGQEARLLIDQVRAALDRGHDRLGGGSAPHFIAGTFAVEALVQDGPRTQILRLRHRDLGTPYALKVLHPNHAGNPVYTELLLDEARKHLSLCHEHIVRAHMALRLADGRPALLLDWMEGGSLAQRLAGLALLTPGDIQAMMAALLTGLRAVHAAGLVHADITPANLLFASDRPASLKLADFDIAMTKRAEAKRGGLVHAQSQLVAPECRVGGLPDARSDLYASGRILMMLLDRCGDNTVPARLHEIAFRLADKDPDRRPQSADEALLLLAASQPPAT